MQQEPNNAAGARVRCGIVLSGGRGTRIRDFVYRIRGHDLPKQYVNFIGKRSMLEHTFHRAEKLIPAERLFTVILREHLRLNEAQRQLVSRPPGSVVIQPENKETAAGLLLPLVHLYKRYPEAVVAVFPADHFILEEDVFMDHVGRAFRIVERDHSRVVLLGLQPLEPAPEYGYIVPANTENGCESDAKEVEMFVEKPAVEAAKTIIRKGALWNTLVMVFTCKTLLTLIQRTSPELYRGFQPILEAIGTKNEMCAIEQVYRELPSVNFSKCVLEVLPFESRRNLLVLPVRGVTWSD